MNTQGGGVVCTGWRGSTIAGTSAWALPVGTATLRYQRAATTGERAQADSYVCVRMRDMVRSKHSVPDLASPNYKAFILHTFLQALGMATPVPGDLGKRRKRQEICADASLPVTLTTAINCGILLSM